MNSLTQAEIIGIETEIKILQDCLRIIEETKEKYEELDKYRENPLIKEGIKFDSLDFCFLIHDKSFYLSHTMYDRQRLLEGTESPYKAVEIVKYQTGDDPEWDAEWKRMNSFYSDDIEDWETPHFLTNKVTDEVFCTLEGYARLSRLPIETIFKRVWVRNSFKEFNMQEIDFGDKRVKIVPLTEVAKWLVNDNPGMVEWLIGSDGVILPTDFITQIRSQRKRDTKPQAKSTSVQSQPASISKRVEGIVYLIGNRENNTLKIGFTSNDVRMRLATFQVSCAHQLEILKTKKGNLQDERELLERFKEFNIRREWFTWNNSIIENF